MKTQEIDDVEDVIDSVKDKLNVVKERLITLRKYHALAIIVFPFSAVIFVFHFFNLFSLSFISFLLVVALGSCVLWIIVCCWVAVTFSMFCLGLFFAVSLLCPWYLGYHLFCTKFF